MRGERGGRLLKSEDFFFFIIKFQTLGLTSLFGGMAGRGE